MLLGNYSVLNRNPLRYLGGGTATPQCNHQSNFNRGGARKNRQFVDQTTAANKQFSLPYGSYPTYAWLIPQVGGDLSARRSADFGIEPSATGGRGYPGFGSATIGIDTNTPAGDLVTTVPAGGAPASIGISTNTPQLTASIGGTGSASFGIDANTPTLGAEASLIGAASFGLDGTLTRYAIGIMSGTTTDAGLTVDSVVSGVWGALAAAYNDSGTMGNKLNTASSGGVDLAALADAVRTELGVELAAVLEVWRRHGLDIAAPLTQTTTAITAGDIALAITGDPDVSVTVTRQP